MPMFLAVRSGSQAGSRIRLNAGQSVRIGRTTNADFAFPDDPHMSGVHCRVECVGEQCRVEDLNSSNGSYVNGRRVTTAVAGNGDTLAAGGTEFLVLVESPEAAAGAGPAVAVGPAIAAESVVAPQTPQDRLLALLRNDFQPLYAVLDAARDIRILALLLHFQEPCQSLYEGQQGATMAQVAPYLVRLVKESPLLEALVKEGWGQSWGVYLTCAGEFHEVRSHLRHFLEAKLPSGEQVYFRYYDPRVLRVFLPTCTPEDTTQFFGPIQSYLAEDENPETLLRFFNTGMGVQSTPVGLHGRDLQAEEAAQRTKLHRLEPGWRSTL